MLKSPFCVHPKTGNICVPFDSNKVESFKLADVPTLTTVINELGECGRTSSDGESISLPSLDPYIALFKKHIRQCILKQEKGKEVVKEKVDF